LFNDTSAPGKRSLWALPMSGNREPHIVLSNVIDVHQARFSPDGRWIAYTTNELGRFEVFITGFPAARERWLVSTGGGTSPMWRPDGQELFYLDLHQNLMAAQANGGGRFSIPRLLFQTGLQALSQSGYGHDYGVDSARKRFLLKRAVEDSALPSVNVVLNWTALLKK